jgi:cytochrome c553
MRYAIMEALVAVAAINPDAGSAESRAGKDLYVRYCCASCHGVDAKGPREMPVWGSLLSQDELTAIAEHLYSLQVDQPR